MTTLQGDCRDTLKTIPSGTVQCCVTSPPYWGLRSYLPKGHPDKHREIGQEKTPDEFVAAMVDVFRDARRVLHDSGTLWLNLGDSYARNPAKGGSGTPNGRNNRGENYPSRKGIASEGGELSDNWLRARNVSEGAEAIKEKNLCMIPWRVALALQADGWYLRSVICWAKKSCMPESVTDRPTSSWEPIFLLAKNSSYFYDAFAVREQGAESSVERYKYEMMVGAKERNGGGRPNDAANTPGMKEYTGYRNQRNVWHLGPEPFSDAHFATFPSEIPKRAIMAGTSERGCCPVCFAPWVRVVESKPAVVKSPASEYGNGAGRSDGNRSHLVGAETRTTVWRASCTCGREDTIPCTVLDCFSGSGRTASVAQSLGRQWIACELNPEYSNMLEKQTAQSALSFL
jgi:DNA modification methylase